MLTHIHPKLPMKDKEATKNYYLKVLGFELCADYGDYLIIEKQNVEIHFFEFKELDAAINYGQVYIRTNDIDELYKSLINKNISIHPNAPLQVKPWGQKEVSLLDPKNNLLTFGQAV